MNLNNFTTEAILEALPQNRALQKDSGLWFIYQYSNLHGTDINVIRQRVNETLRQFLIRYIEYLRDWETENYQDFCTNISI